MAQFVNATRAPCDPDPEVTNEPPPNGWDSDSDGIDDQHDLCPCEEGPEPGCPEPCPEPLRLAEWHIYGSSAFGRFATVKPANIWRPTGAGEPVDTAVHTYTRILDEKYFELKDHLGNVRVVVTDVKKPATQSGQHPNVAVVASYNNYYPYGMLQPERNWQAEGYRYGFNGKEMDNEVKGVTGGSYDYGFRVLDPRAGRFASVDPLEPDYPGWSPYAYAMNRVVDGMDLDGAEFVSATTRLIEVAGDGTIVLSYDNLSGPSQSRLRELQRQTWPDGSIGIQTDYGRIQTPYDPPGNSATTADPPPPSAAQQATAMPRLYKPGEPGVPNPLPQPPGAGEKPPPPSPRRNVPPTAPVAPLPTHVPPPASARPMAVGVGVVAAVGAALEVGAALLRGSDGAQIKNQLSQIRRSGAAVGMANQAGMIPATLQTRFGLVALTAFAFSGQNMGTTPDERALVESVGKAIIKTYVKQFADTALWQSPSSVNATLPRHVEPADNTQTR